MNASSVAKAKGLYQRRDVDALANVGDSIAERHIERAMSRSHCGVLLEDHDETSIFLGSGVAISKTADIAATAPDARPNCAHAGQRLAGTSGSEHSHCVLLSVRRPD
jgi:hypothetical protein